MEDLIIYSSTDGQTKKICETIKSHISSNNNLKIISLNEALNLNLEKCKKIILGASIRYGRHNKKVLHEGNILYQHEALKQIDIPRVKKFLELNPEYKV